MEPIPELHVTAPPGLSAEQARSLALIPEIAAMVGELREAMRGTIKEYYTVDEFAAVVGRAPYTVRAWIAGGRIRATRVEGTGPRGRLLIPGDQLHAVVGQGRGGDVPAAALGRTGPRRSATAAHRMGREGGLPDGQERKTL